LADQNLENFTMQKEHFDLNDTQHEPTDEQLETLMNLVAIEASRRAELANRELMRRLREEIVAANNRPQATA
jgi:hypothetical protein